MPSFTVFKGSKDRKIVKSESTREIMPDEVLIKVTHSGLCGTDEHHRHRDIVLGHEGAGIVEETGSEVKGFSKGESVGWGFQHNSCMACKQCLTGRETICPGRSMYATTDLDQGSFASHAVWKANFIYKIPEGMERKYAAPLMCGGATVFNALHSFGARSTDRVGVIGVGGLGHLAIQFAAKMGCEVVVFSGTDSKKEEATKLGATEFVIARGVSELKVDRGIDYLIVTTSQQPDWSLYLPIMAPGGTIIPLSVSKEDLTIPYMPILRKELSIQGSLIAARQVHREMLRFAAVHGIKPIIEEFPMTVDGITEAMEKLENGHMRYRGVLVAQ